MDLGSLAFQNLVFLELVFKAEAAEFRAVIAAFSHVIAV
jgi:hypothetical protein